MEMQLILKEWGIWSTGTIRENRTRGCSLKTDKEMKKAGRGSVDISVEKSTGLEVIKWMDNRSVMVSSTYLGVRPIGTVQCRQKVMHPPMIFMILIVISLFLL
jgi:hypothetical protein